MKTKITEYRKKLNLTQEQLAEMAGVTRQTIISIEQGRFNPSLMLAYKIKKSLKKKFIEHIFDMEN